MIDLPGAANRLSAEAGRIDLQALLRPHELSGGREGKGTQRFVAESHWTPYGPLYGGQMLAQAVMCAGRTVEGSSRERKVSAVQAAFVDRGDVQQDVEIWVRSLRSSRNSDLRQVEVTQSDRVLMVGSVSFAVACPGPDHQITMPAVPAPDELSALSDHLRLETSNLATYLTDVLPIEQRHVDGPVSIANSLPAADHQLCWLRALGDLGSDPLLHAAAFTYMSDYLVMEGALRRHQLYVNDPQLVVVSLTHNIWFHREVRADGWLLLDARSPSAADGVALGVSHAFARDGSLVATVAQEATLKRRAA